jgi:hypothetical protein
VSYGQYGGHRQSSSQRVRHPAWRKAYLWFFCLAGSGICIAVLAASLAPAGANRVQPAGGVLGGLGLAFSIWLGWCAHRVQLRGQGDAQPQAVVGLADPAMPARPDSGGAAQLDQAMNVPLDSAADVQVSPIKAARLELQRRQEALAVLHRDPALAKELRIGRPDLPRTFDDGHLVDANHVPAPFLAAVPGIDQALAEKIVSTREGVGGFSSLADLEVTLDLTPEIVSQLQDRLIFMPMK